MDSASNIKSSLNTFVSPAISKGIANSKKSAGFIISHTSSSRCSAPVQNTHRIVNNQGWGPRGLASTSRTPQGQNFVALALKTPGLGLDHVVLEHIPADGQGAVSRSRFCNHCWRKFCPFRQCLLLLRASSARVAWLCAQTELGSERSYCASSVFLKCISDL